MLSWTSIEEIYDLRAWNESWSDVDYEIKKDLYLAEYRTLADDEKSEVWITGDLIMNPDELARKKGVWSVLHDKSVTDDLFRLAKTESIDDDMWELAMDLQTKLITNLFNYFDDVFEDYFNGDR
tara:strand:+ start:1070 stop:1441 length:372 start_codon:yes stop_codon:yes gene_type:complete